MKKAIILFNLGGPDKLENVEPFLFNLFYDPAILNLPNFLRYPLAKLISKRRAPIAKKIYDAGTCLLKKAKNKKTGTKNHKLNLLVLNDLMSKIIAIIDKKVEWWSTKGVPLEG